MRIVRVSSDDVLHQLMADNILLRELMDHNIIHAFQYLHRFDQAGAVRIGQVENREAATGCTVMVCENGMRAGVDVRGGGPASRESQLLNPLMAAQSIHAIVLSGGSAYGLGAANGVMQYLEEHGYGFDTGFAKVPLVAQADIYDLSVGSADVRPDAGHGIRSRKAGL